MAETLLEAKVDLVAAIDANDIARALGQNDELIFTFIIDLLDEAGSSDLEEMLRDRLKDRSAERAGLS